MDAKQELEKYYELAKHIERMAATGRTGCLIQWSSFIEELNNTLKCLSEARETYFKGYMKANGELYMAENWRVQDTKDIEKFKNQLAWIEQNHPDIFKQIPK